MAPWMFAEAVDDACDHFLDPARCLDPECIDRRERERRDGMSTVIVYAGPAGGPAVPGSFLRSYDLEAAGGRGTATWTSDKSRALAFSSFIEAFEAWRAIPESRPLRPDGEPNRPLTAFTVTFEEGPQ